MAMGSTFLREWQAVAFERAVVTRECRQLQSKTCASGPGLWCGVLLVFSAGMSIPLAWPVVWPVAWGLGLAAAGALAVGGWLLWWHRAWGYAPLWWAVGVLAWCLLGTGVAASRHSWQAQHALAPVLEGRDLTVVGRVEGLPDAAPQAWRFDLRVDHALLDGQPVTLPPRIRVSWAFFQGVPTQAPVLSGERWRLVVRLRAPHGNANPHGFDTELWAWQRRLGAMGYVRDAGAGQAPQRLDTAPWSMARWRQQLRDAVLADVTPARTAGVLAALLVGDQAAIDRADWALYRDTGVAHLMAISGLHITLFAWLATALVRGGWRLGARRWPALALRWPAPRVAAWGGLTLAAGYAVLAGWEIPAQRTVLMLGLAVAMAQSGRRWPVALQWLLVLAAVLLLDPLAPLQPGFWLSFVAVGLLWLGAGVQRPPRPTHTSRWRALGAALVSLWREQWVITLGLTPLTLVLFGQFAWVSVLANLLAIPWVTWVVTPLTLLGALVPGVWTLAAWALDGLHVVLHTVAKWPWSVLVWPTPPWYWALLAVCGGVALAGPWPWRWRSAGVWMLLPVLLWTPARPAPGQFEVLVLDVGQGGGTLIRTARHSLLYDTGPRWGPESDAGDRVIVPLLRALGERLSGVVVSHSDSDHSGGSAALRRAQPQAWWLASFMEGQQARCEAGQRWQWDGVDFEILHPWPSDYRTDPASGAWAGTLSSNAMSCVLRVSAAGASVWLGGDIDSARELRLALQRPTPVTAMLAPHHGSHTSSSPVLLNTLLPQQVWVQAGYRNRYGHPSALVRQRWAERSLVPVETARCGAIGWSSTDPAAWSCERQRRQRFWHHRMPSAPE
jgi:competence protein ComEC